MSDKGYPGSTTDRHQGGQLRRVNTVAAQQIEQSLDHTTEGSLDHSVQFGAGQPDCAANPGQAGGTLIAELFLGGAALFAQPGQCGHGCGPGRFGIQSAQDVAQHFLVDQVAGEVLVTHRLPDGREPCRSIGQGQAGAGTAEIAQGDDAACGQTRMRLDRRQRRDRIGNDPDAWHRPPHRLNGTTTPMRGHRQHGHVGPMRRAALPRQRLDRAGQQPFGVMRRTVGGDERHRVTHPSDEIGEHQPAIDGWRRADHGPAMCGHGEHRPPYQRRMIGDRHQIGRPHGQPQAITHTCMSAESPNSLGPPQDEVQYWRDEYSATSASALRTAARQARVVNGSLSG